MKKTALLLFLFLLAQMGMGRGSAKRFLSFIPADSVTLHDFVFFQRLHKELAKDVPNTAPWFPVVKRSDKKKLALYEREWKDRVENRLSIIGGEEGKQTLEESVSSAIKMLELTEKLFLLTGKSCYASLMERSLYNGVLAGIAPCVSSETRMQAAKHIFGVKSLIYAARGIDVFVNLQVASTSVIQTDSLYLCVLQKTSAPWSPNSSFGFRFKKPSQHMRLHLRVPSCMTNEVVPGTKRFRFLPSHKYFEIYINGRLTSLEQKDGYVVIDRIWLSDDIVVFKTGYSVRRIVLGAKDPRKSPVALQRGPFVFALKEPNDSVLIKSGDPIGEEYDRKTKNTIILLKGTFFHVNNTKTQEEKVPFSAIPYYVAAKETIYPQQLWIPQK